MFPQNPLPMRSAAVQRVKSCKLAISMLTLKLFGNPSISFANETLEPSVTKPLALLYYLAFQAEWVSRDQLALLFYPDDESKSARAKLRQLINRCKKLAFTETLEVEDTRLRWLVNSDVLSFKQALDAQDWMNATHAYEGILLKNVVLNDASGFDAWLELERSDLRISWQEAALRAAEDLARTGRQSDASMLLRRVWNLSDYDEASLQAYMRTAYSSGHKDAALKVFEVFQKQLADEFAMEASEESVVLAKAISEDAVVREKVTAPAPKAPAKQLSELIGRHTELEELSDLLSKDDCKLLALTGLGGVGKTRLALELAEKQILQFEHGTFLVSLAGVQDSERIVSAIAQALSFSFYGNRDPKEQLSDYLQNKQTLLLIDNLEHLLEGAAVLSDLLEHAPRLKLLITSRQKPELPDVWVYPLKGLTYQTEGSDAEALFIKKALRQEPSFEVKNNKAAIRDLCALVEGLPLALELAAAWVKDLSCEEILSEIKSNLDFLKRDSSDHQANMRAVFEHSWALLSPEQQSLLAQLSIFRGGFSREAAQEIMHVSAYLLLSLSSRSLIRKEAANRYSVHELVRQFAEDKLSSEQRRNVQAKHAQYFVAFLQNQEADLFGAKQQESLASVHTDLNNIQSLWLWLSQNNLDLLDSILKPFLHFYEVKCLFKEADSALKAASLLVTKDSLLHTKLLIRQGIFQTHLGAMAEAERNLKQGLAQAKQQNNNTEVALALMNIGQLERKKGNYLIASGTWRESLVLYEQLNDQHQIGNLLNNLGIIAAISENLDEAHRYFSKSLELRQSLQDQRGIAIVKKNLGNVLRETGHYQEAKLLYEEALALSEALDDKQGIAFGLGVLAKIHLFEENYDKAQKCFKESAELRAEMGDLWGLAVSTDNLGVVARLKKDYASAKGHHKRSLALRKRIKDEQGVADSHFGLGQLARAMGHAELALSYLEQSLAANQSIKNNWCIATSQLEIGQVHLATEQPEHAKRHVLNALKHAQQTRAEPLLLQILPVLAKLYKTEGNLEGALLLAKTTAQHSACEAALRRDTLELQSELEAQLSSSTLKAIETQTQQTSLKELVESIVIPLDSQA